MINIGKLHRSKQMISTAKKPSNQIKKRRFTISKKSIPGSSIIIIFCRRLHTPQAAYLDNEIKSKGLIVDLLEIESLTLKDAQKIANPLAEGILYQDLPPLPTIEELSQVNEFDALRERFKERLRLEKTFWLKDSSDFVQIEGTIKSPWCEHLMQRFSNVFIRIGLDNPSEDDYNTLIDGCCLEE